jgi:acetolactate synthase-1/2/3 large subunit
VAAAYGIDAQSIANPLEVSAALRWLMQEPLAPSLLRVQIDPFANAFPKIAFGRPITEMEPFAQPIVMEGT